MRSRLAEFIPIPRVLLAAVGIGAIVGLLVATFERITVSVLLEELAELPLWQQAIAPFVGLCLATLLLHYAGRGATPSTSDEYVNSTGTETPVHFHGSSCSSTRVVLRAPPSSAQTTSIAAPGSRTASLRINSRSE